jgi:eukaryotic-like serine/threonine-protein kinase
MEGIILIDRYQIQDLLGSGGSGQTFRGWDLHDQQQVAIKILSLRKASDWKAIELFEREAKTLAQLNHPAIPKYIDFFRAEIMAEESFCIVQELAPGRPLTAWQAEGYAFTSREVRKIAEQVLEILIYLQSFAPPIIHRDIKPANLLRTDAGLIYLVDFGAVRDSYHQTITGGSTLVGTYGYMAPEQFRGRAVLATDLYGLGATLLHLLTGIDPADLPQKNMRLDFRDRLQTKPVFTNWLERMLEPIPEDRFGDARQAHQQLTSGSQLLKAPRPRQPIASLWDDHELLRISIPPIWFAIPATKKHLLVILTCWGLSGFLWWLIVVAELPLTLLILALMALPIFPCLSFGLFSYLQGVGTNQVITLDDEYLKIAYFIGSWRMYSQRILVESIGTVTVHRNRDDFGICGSGIRINSAFSPHRATSPLLVFGYFLGRKEQLWLAGAVKERLGRCQSQCGVVSSSKPQDCSE